MEAATLSCFARPLLYSLYHQVLLLVPFQLVPYQYLLLSDFATLDD
jgi:hypothetical protein